MTLIWAAAGLLAVAGAGSLAIAQIEGGDRGVAPIDSSGSFEVSGINVDIRAKTAEAARLGGWREAQRRGWRMLSQRLGGGGGSLPDSTLDSIVSGIVVENEEIGPNRYVARLGVLFDRARAGQLLGVGGNSLRSPPLLVIPVQVSGGVAQVFETRTEWQKAWARYRTGNSAIDYVRPSGTGPDALLLTASQIHRPGRGWWRTLLDGFGAADVIIPRVTLTRQWPGGPVIGTFEARHGPDNRLISRFALRVARTDAIPALMDAGVRRMDEIYEGALRSGILRPDPLLTFEPPVAEGEEELIEELPTELVIDPFTMPASGSVISIQFDTPNVSSVSAGEAALRGIPGVRSAATTSLALGGTSVMRVQYDGGQPGLAAALTARGWQVQAGEGVLRITRAAPAAPPPAPPAEPGADGAEP
ncbi:heavy-metal-associated domain-containing protein [Sphingomonas gilva]|uniref:heavy-metal-associated domain-containing protein n=1 Tax=Sphingomonas gilva TaxID=2305907 RepID=UPI001FEBEF57|nr:heavy-metal-associated domain-containing protein [Sphingomonas gilva]